MPDPAGLSARLFFALWPDAAVRAQLLQAQQHLHAAFGGRCMAADTLHLTLLFVGACPRARLDEWVKMAAEVRFKPFALTLDRAECWRHNHIASLTAASTPPALAELSGQLILRAEALGVACERRPFVPHVTLLRNAECAGVTPVVGPVVEPVVGPINWTVSGFSLVESNLTPTGARYQTLAYRSAE